MGAREVMRKVRDGYRLERPAHCHPDLYHIIQKCWLGDMNKRPDFAELRKVLNIHDIKIFVISLTATLIVTQPFQSELTA